MKILQAKVLFLGVMFSCSTLPGLAQSGQVGSDYLMTHTWIDQDTVGSKINKSNNKAKPRSLAQAQTASAAAPMETTANTQAFPTQILKTGVSLTAPSLSPNSLQLADNIGLTPVLERISALRSQVADLRGSQTLESMSTRQDLYDATLSARLTVQKVSLEIDSTVAEIESEKGVYTEILNTFTSDRDKALARTNALAFISNGALWAVCESFVIPTYKHPIYNIPAGITGIPAGVVPSIASMYTFKLINGKKKTSEVEPNMLAKLFDYPTNAEIEYPKSIWTYLNQAPADNPNSKKRLEQLVDRWIADANMPAFTDRHSKKQLDIITASAAQKKGLTIATLTARTVMLHQLLCELQKMKRLLLELDMVALGDKQFIADKVTPKQI